MTNTDAQLWAAARQLVRDMNPHEAARFAYYEPCWPGWAQRDTETAYRALRWAAGRLPIEPSYAPLCK